MVRQKGSDAKISDRRNANDGPIQADLAVSDHHGRGNGCLRPAGPNAGGQSILITTSS